MTAYILNIVGICVVSVIVESLLSESSINKHVKSVLALTILFVIVVPLPNLISDFKNFDFSLEAGYENNVSVLDEGYIEKINLLKSENVKNTIKQILKAKGLNNIELELNIDLRGADFKINSVIVYGGFNYGEKKAILEVVMAVADIGEEYVTFD